ncbi:MAG: hypothetical protein F7C38_02190 [Desulfurococcales archaeon]|nr:hypothetical protein [Desulfurococcales archaeon]
MRILLIHAEEIWYKTHKPAIKNPPDPPSEYASRNATVAYLSVERGDSEEAAAEAAREILKYARDTVKSSSIVLYPYAHLSSNLERPAKAHRILVMIERELRGAWEGELHRAPFGWYKEFKLHAKGHPLAELSRTITPTEARVWYRYEGKRIDLDKAINMKLVPECLSPGTLRFSGLTKEKIELFGLTRFESWISTNLVARLKQRIEALQRPVDHYRNTPYVDPSDMHMVDKVKHLYIEGSTAPLNSVTGTPLASAVVKTEASISEILEEIDPGMVKQLHRIKLCGDADCLDLGVEGNLVLYQGKACLPLGVETEGYTLVGPLGNLARAAVDYEATAAEATDHTPTLPVWLHPITVYVIPVGETVADYTRTIVRELASIGASVVVDETTKGVGARVRRAGRLWAPYIATIGEREMESGTVTVRRRARPGTQEVLPFSELVSEVKGLLSLYGVSGTIRYLT